jgi:ubiquinone/menaquinone biosynthesis C-methylase UbiE
MTVSTQGQPNDLYSSPYLVDYYDLVTTTSQSNNDAFFYWKIYQNERSRRSFTADDPFILMDVGTGTGRVLHGLGRMSVEANTDFFNTEVLGVDNAAHMLEKAEQITTTPLKEHVTWINGSALDLEAVMRDRTHSQVDLLIFSFGSISHLSKHGQPEAFLNQVSKVLRPGTGRAYVSIYDGSILQKRNDIAIHQPKRVTETQSKSFPHVLYRESNHRGDLEGNVKFVKFDLEAVNNQDQSILEKNEISMKMRQWEVDELVPLSSKTGVAFVESIRGAHETFYVFKTMD